MSNKLVTSEEVAKEILKIMEEVAKEHNVTVEEMMTAWVDGVNARNGFPKEDTK